MNTQAPRQSANRNLAVLLTLALTASFGLSAACSPAGQLHTHRVHTATSLVLM